MDSSRHYIQGIMVTQLVFKIMYFHINSVHKQNAQDPYTKVTLAQNVKYKIN